MNHFISALRNRATEGVGQTLNPNKIKSSSAIFVSFALEASENRTESPMQHIAVLCHAVLLKLDRFLQVDRAGFEYFSNPDVLSRKQCNVGLECSIHRAKGNFLNLQLNRVLYLLGHLIKISEYLLFHGTY